MRTPASLFLLAVFFALSASHHGAAAQTKDNINIPDLNILQKELRPSSRSLETKSMAVPMDAPVNPEEYYVGPGDQLSINVWSSAPVEYQVMVTPEGTLLVPTVGSAVVKDLSLAQVKTLVSNMTARKYVRAEISVTLISPRRLVVTLLGNVLNEGRKEISAVQRVDDLIAAANDISQQRMTYEDYAQEILKMRKEASERRITVKRRGGEILHVDLAMYRATGIGSYNPYLREGDVVYVPQRNDFDNSIAVFGGTMSAANFEYLPGDSLRGLIGMALGFGSKALPEQAILARLSTDGRSMDTLRVNARAVLEKTAPDIPLRPGDRLVIPEPTDARRNYRVRVEGEVAIPGMYPIAENGTHLSEIIKLAGGFRVDANLAGASLVRNGLPSFETSTDHLTEEQLLSRRTSLPAQDSSYYLTETALRVKGEPVVVDFEKLFMHGDSTQDVILQPYDKISIPAIRHTVYVFGQVIEPGHVPYTAGEDYKYYVEKAGGFTDEARSGDLKVIKGSTRTWLDPGETTIEDGDYIWVPKEPQYPFSYYLTTWAQIAGIVGTVATVALLVNSLK